MPDLNALPLDRLYGELGAGGLILRALELARDEDLGHGDITSGACIDAAARGQGVIVARARGVVAGLAALPDLLRVFGGTLRAHPLTRDGADGRAGAGVARLSGPLHELLALERTALNLLGRLSGVATLTRSYVTAAAQGSPKAGVYDTRKTTPGLRALEKYAVRCGGGRSHRLGLFDAVLIKDNHLAGVPAGRLGAFIRDAARRARAASPGLLFVEAEVDTLEQLGQVLALEPGTVNIVLLDNMTVDELRRAVALRDASPARPELEASGGVRLETIAAIAATGVDRISAGALTHSAASLDVALEVEA
ncbi:MAG: carboxylating nicotinate-nucleotide diphosphorylase [Phycisphaerales bacterium]